MATTASLGRLRRRWTHGGSKLLTTTGLASHVDHCAEATFRAEVSVLALNLLHFLLEQVWIYQLHTLAVIHD